MKPTNPDPGEMADGSISYIPDNGVCVQLATCKHLMYTHSGENFITAHKLF